MANQVKIKINKIKDRGPEERLDWRRKYLKRKTERKTEHNRAVREKVSNLRRSLRKATEVGDEAMQRLKAAAEELEIIGDVRGRGLMIGVELVANRETGEPISPDRTGAIVDAMLQRGMIMVPCGRYGNVLRLMPSLTIPRSYLDAGIDIMLDVLRNAQSAAAE